MIEQDIARLLAWPVVFNLVVIFGCWLYYSNRSGWSDEPVRRGRLYRCAQCGAVYEGERQAPRNACPECGHYNDAAVR
jgi:hypothetical protein